MPDPNFREQYFNLRDILMKIICETFDNVLGRGTEYALTFTFVLTSKREITLTLYAPSNYVKVIEGVWSKNGKTCTYNMMSDHDSCWRYDGVENFVRKYSEELERMIYNSVLKFKPTPETVEIWREMARNRDFHYVEKLNA